MLNLDSTDEQLAPVVSGPLEDGGADGCVRAVRTAQVWSGMQKRKDWSAVARLLAFPEC